MDISASVSRMAVDDSITPTRANFSSSPATSLKMESSSPQSSNARVSLDGSQSSAKSPMKESGDIDMDDSDGEGASDDESVNADGSKSGKKKKSQRFYCTDYPPCNLSFTRSEHLARHIRKHTGERPFQCHCSRRFSRLDNLRQHAQTVHVNEDIPIDSLAASGSRFQRQIRTDRVRQAGNRARASTGGSAGGPVRGHSKSLSTSSINSISSVGSGYGYQPDARRRPPPLVMANDPRSRLSTESYRSNGDSNYSYRPQSPSDFSTPTSATFSTAQSSPRWPSGIGSPTTSHSRSHSMYSVGGRAPARRLSVPSGVSPYPPQSQAAAGARLSFGPPLVNSSNSGAFSPSNSGILSSPTASSSGWSARRDSTSSQPGVGVEEAWRRRTWHPDNNRGYNNAQSGVISSNPPPPMANLPNNNNSQQQQQAGGGLRLPGIESFDPLRPRPGSPVRRQPSPMMVDSEHPREERRNLNMYDASLQRGITRLDISHKNSPIDGASSWASEANRAVQAQAERPHHHAPTVRFEEPQHPPREYSAPSSNQSLHQHTMSAPSLVTSREAKRRGWYHGPPPSATTQQQQQHQSSQEPQASRVERMVHPNFNSFTGFPANEQPPPPQEHHPNNQDSLRRLEALVAVATSEGTAATAY